MDLDEIGDDTEVRAELVRRLDAVVFELGEMDRRLLDLPRLMFDAGLVREARRRVITLCDEATSLLTWMTETRLELPTN